jgi:hypothetical protein
MYTPPNTTSSAPGHFRLGLQGYPGTGKTHSALTFPNIYALDFDHKLPSGIDTANFWDPAFVDSIVKRGNPKWPANRANALIIWLDNHGAKFEPERTLLIDSYTMLDNSWHAYQDCSPPVTKDGEFNGLKYWGNKIEYNRALFDRFKSLSCNVIMTFHESEKTNVDGVVTNKCRPLTQGSFRDQLAGHFTAFFRCVKDPVLRDPKTNAVLKDAAGKPLEAVGYKWQVIGDSDFDAVASPELLITEKYVEPGYQSILKMMKGTQAQ